MFEEFTNHDIIVGGIKKISFNHRRLSNFVKKIQTSGDFDKDDIKLLQKGFQRSLHFGTNVYCDLIRLEKRLEKSKVCPEKMA